MFRCAGLRTAAATALAAASMWLGRAAAAEPPLASNAAPAQPAQQLDAVNVTDQRYQKVPLDVPFNRAGILGVQLGPPPDFPTYLDTLVVTASRTPQLPERVAATAQVFDSAAVRNAPTATLDSVLRAVPSFSLFRRSDSLTANPTTQGVSLRGLGPSGASRSLVLLDGVPLNDPFGGWVNWSQIPRDAVARVEVIPGGGATAWGDAALGGVLQVFLQPAQTEQIVIDRPPTPIAWGSRGTAQMSAEVGDFATRRGSVIVNRPAGRNGVVQILAEDFATNGFSIVAPERRGSIDVPAWSRHRSFGARWREAVSTNTEVSVTVRGFEEFRGNGTPYQRNGTRSKFASVQGAGQPSPNFTWSAVAYAQQQTYASTFSAINSTRTAEAPASDQFAVPATALGASWTGTWVHRDGATTGFGLDGRTVHGETRENYNFSGGDFTRQRIAGGTQDFGGVFVVHQQPLLPTVRLTLGARVDDWRDENGHRTERVRSTGAVTRADQYDAHTDTELSPSLGLVWTPTRSWRLKSSAQQAFRRPTLNELYRPFRQGANVTEANANLSTEHVTSAEAGIEWMLWPNKSAPADRTREPGLGARQRTHPRLTLGATAFWNDLHDAVTNVTVARGPGTFPLFGALPAGGVGRERLNIDRVEVQGAELSAVWTPASSLSVTAAYLYDDATVRRATIAPALVGKRLPEVPRHATSLGVTWQAPLQLTVTSRLRWIGRQFDDDENTLRLGETLVADLGVTRPLTKHLTLFLNVENAGDARIETARSADGVVNVGTPRLVIGGVRGRW